MPPAGETGTRCPPDRRHAAAAPATVGRTVTCSGEPGDRPAHRMPFLNAARGSVAVRVSRRYRRAFAGSRVRPGVVGRVHRSIAVRGTHGMTRTARHVACQPAPRPEIAGRCLALIVTLLGPETRGQAPAGDGPDRTRSARRHRIAHAAAPDRSRRRCDGDRCRRRLRTAAAKASLRCCRGNRASRSSATAVPARRRAYSSAARTARRRWC